MTQLFFCWYIFACCFLYSFFLLFTLLSVSKVYLFILKAAWYAGSLAQLVTTFFICLSFVFFWFCRSVFFLHLVPLQSTYVCVFFFDDCTFVVLKLVMRLLNHCFFIRVVKYKKNVAKTFRHFFLAQFLLIIVIVYYVMSLVQNR